MKKNYQQVNVEIFNLEKQDILTMSKPGIVDDENVIVDDYGEISN